MTRKRDSTAHWRNAFMFGLECQQVIGLRLLKLAMGGKPAQRESRRMVSEKMDAAFAAGALALRGATLGSLTKSYRAKVRANVRRLSK